MAPVIVVDFLLIGEGKALLKPICAQRLNASERFAEMRVDGTAGGCVNALQLDVRGPAIAHTERMIIYDEDMFYQPLDLTGLSMI